MGDKPSKIAPREDMATRNIDDDRPIAPGPTTYVAPTGPVSMRPEVIAFLINSALYLFSVIWAGLFWGNKIAVAFAIATLGIATIGYAVQIMASAHRKIAVACVMASYVTGAIAGLSLLKAFM